MNGTDDRAGAPAGEAFERLLQLAVRDSRSRVLVAAVIERSGLDAAERAAILREFFDRARDPRED